jgi:hypothetical protein
LLSGDISDARAFEYLIYRENCRYARPVTYEAAVSRNAYVAGKYLLDAKATMRCTWLFEKLLAANSERARLHIAHLGGAGIADE